MIYPSPVDRFWLNKLETDFVAESYRRRLRRRRVLSAAVIFALLASLLTSLYIASQNRVVGKQACGYRTKTLQLRDELAVRATAEANAILKHDRANQKAEEATYAQRRSRANELATHAQATLDNEADPSGSLPLLLAIETA